MEILIVEDDPTTALFISESIKRMHHDFEMAGTGKEAIEKIKNKDFDMVLLDIFLPDCQGQELIPQMKSFQHDIGIVTMTGYNSRDLELEVRRQGILFYMLKPVSYQTLNEIVDHVTQKRAKEDMAA